MLISNFLLPKNVVQGKAGLAAVGQKRVATGSVVTALNLRDQISAGHGAEEIVLKVKRLFLSTTTTTITIILRG